MAKKANALKTAGVTDGAKWRKEEATKGQVTRLRRFFRERPDFQDWFEEAEDCGDIASSTLAEIIDPELSLGLGYGPDSRELFWNGVMGEDGDTDDADYLEGFIEGALAA